MAEVKWIKITTDMFDNGKIKFIRTLPEGNSIVLLWVMLLTKAGKCNSNGYIFLTESIPYTPEMLANEFDFELNTVKMALQTFEKLKMIELEDTTICIPGWSEHQNVEGLEKIKQQNRLRAAKHRKKQKQLTSNVTDNVTVTQSNATDIDKERDIDIEEDIDIERDKEENKIKISWKEILITWNDLPNSIKPIRAITDRRKAKVRARMNNLKLTTEDVILAINNIRASSFCQGKNSKGWVIDFDWLFKDDNNFSKVLEGKYNNNSNIERTSKYNKNVQNGLEIYNKALEEEQSGQGGKSVWDV